MKPNKWITVILGMTLSALLLTGCGSVKKEGKSEDAPEISKGYPLTVSHAFGDTVLKSKPKRIVKIGRAHV